MFILIEPMRLGGMVEGFKRRGNPLVGRSTCARFRWPGK